MNQLPSIPYNERRVFSNRTITRPHTQKNKTRKTKRIGEKPAIGLPEVDAAKTKRTKVGCVLRACFACVIERKRQRKKQKQNNQTTWHVFLPWLAIHFFFSSEHDEITRKQKSNGEQEQEEEGKITSAKVTRDRLCTQTKSRLICWQALPRAIIGRGFSLSLSRRVWQTLDKRGGTSKRRNYCEGGIDDNPNR